MSDVSTAARVSPRRLSRVPVQAASRPGGTKLRLISGRSSVSSFSPVTAPDSVTAMTYCLRSCSMVVKVTTADGPESCFPSARATVQRVPPEIPIKYLPVESNCSCVVGCPDRDNRNSHVVASQTINRTAVAAASRCPSALNAIWVTCSGTGRDAAVSPVSVRRIRTRPSHQLVATWSLAG